MWEQEVAVLQARFPHSTASDLACAQTPFDSSLPQFKAAALRLVPIWSSSFFSRH